MKRYPEEVVDFIKTNIKGVKYKDMAKMLLEKFNFKVTGEALEQWCAHHNCRNGVDGHFSKGHTPANKGKTWDEYMPKEKQELARQTCFNSEKIVNKQNHNWYHKVGDERLDRDGYVIVKVVEHAKERGGSAKNSTRAWQLKQRYIWEQNYGHIPYGNIIIFLDGNRFNFELDNLAMISMADNAYINKHHLRYDDPELTKIGITIARLNTLIANKRKENK